MDRTQSTAAADFSRIPALDGVRGLAVLAVLVFHTLPIPDHFSTAITIWNAVVKSCWVGVDLFFILSGFLITRVLFENKGQPNYFINFYIRRVLRIAPLYYFSIAAAIYVLPAIIPASVLPPLFHRLIENQIWLWLFLQNFIQARSPHQLPGFGHFWTLAVEEQFYLAWPVFVFWLSRRSIMLFALGICILEPLARWLCLSSGFSLGAVRQLTYLRLDSILFGALLYLLHSELNRHRFSLVTLSTCIQISSAAAVAGLMFVFLRHSELPYQSLSTALIGYTSIGILGTTLIYLCLSSQSQAARIFSTPILRWFGTYSYGIYVFSVPAILGFQALPLARIQDPFLLPLARLLFSGIISTAFALVSWRLLEVPFLRLKARFLPGSLKLTLVPVINPVA
jgi:peptidoglycan/LPS O-acetylase OafA/YrhL